MTCSTPDLIVIGSGLAGTACVRAASSRGLRTLLVDQGPRIASGASGNSHGLMAPYITTTSSPRGIFYRQAFVTARAMYLELAAAGALPSLQQTGSLQLPYSHRNSNLFDRIRRGDTWYPVDARIVSPEEASELAGVPIEREAIHFASSLTISPRALCEVSVSMRKNLVSTRLGVKASEVERDGEVWRLRLSDGTTVEAPYLLLACAFEASAFTITEWLPLEPLRGEVLSVHPSNASRSLRMPVCYDGYILPLHEDSHIVGAGYHHGRFDTQPRPEDRQDLVRRLSLALPRIDVSQLKVDSSRVSFRTSTFDRLPYVGPLPDIQLGSARRPYDTLPSLPGVGISLGHGSRGLVSTPLSAEIALRSALGEPQGELAEFATAVSPSRYVRKFLNAPSASASISVRT